MPTVTAMGRERRVAGRKRPSEPVGHGALCSSLRRQPIGRVALPKRLNSAMDNQMVLRIVGMVLAAVVAVSAPVFGSPGDSDEVMRFPENPHYGYVKPANSDLGEGTLYYLIRFDSSLSTMKEYSVLTSVLSLSPPQLCDRDAVSFTISRNPDSSSLLVAYLQSEVSIDTLLTYAEENLRRSGEWRHPQGRVYSLRDYLLYLPDSLLFWVPPGFLRSILTVGRIGTDNRYDDMDYVMESGVPAMANDLSQALFVPYSPVFVPSEYGNDATSVWAYDFAVGSWSPIQRVKGGCGKPRRRTHDGPLYCVSGGRTYSDDYSLCVVNDSIPRPLVTFETPVRIHQYFLYPDSVVVLTTACGIPDYGIQRYVVYE